MLALLVPACLWAVGQGELAVPELPAPRDLDLVQAVDMFMHGHKLMVGVEEGCDGCLGCECCTCRGNDCCFANGGLGCYPAGSCSQSDQTASDPDSKLDMFMCGKNDGRRRRLEQGAMINISWRIYSQEVDRHTTAEIGDTLSFTWGGAHNVWKMASNEALESCDFTNAVRVDSVGRSATYIVDSLPLHFACKVGPHCVNGQKLTVSDRVPPPEHPCAGKECGDVCANSAGDAQVMQYCQPDKTCAPNDSPDCPVVVEPTVVDWRVYSEASRQSMIAKVGDKLKFEWDNVHNVYSMPSAQALADCDFTEAVRLSADSGVMVTIYHLPLYFSCSIGNHCEDGQKLAVAAMVEPTVVDWRIYSPSEQTMTAEVGDTLKFNWNYEHNVYLMPSAQALADCDFTDAEEVGRNSGAEYPVDSLPLYFSCSVSQHCQSGQKLTVSAEVVKTVINWGAYDSIADTMIAEVGDTLSFEWEGGHNVYLMASAQALADCDFNAAVEVGAMSGATHTVASLPLYFSCRVANHCEQGQKLAVAGMGDVKPINWRIYGQEAQRSKTAEVGDLIQFNWEYSHNLYLMPTADALENCVFTNSALISGNSGVVVFVESLPLYFSCSVSSHCENGQKLTVTAESDDEGKVIELNWRALLGNRDESRWEGVADIGDQIKFVWTGNHNVYKMASEQAWRTCNFANSALVSNNSPALYTISELPSFFACRRGSHCRNGQKWAARAKPDPKGAVKEVLQEMHLILRDSGFQAGDHECSSYLKDVVGIDWRMYREDSEKVVEAQVGDLLMFKWEGVHNVYKMPSADALANCDFDGATPVGVNSAMSPVIYNITTTPPLYFSCDIPRHCEDGQKLTVIAPTPPCSELVCGAGETCIEGHGCILIPSDLAEGESCGACNCPPAFTAGECATGLTCIHNPMMQDAPGKCVANGNVCADPCWGMEGYACCGAGETCVREVEAGPGRCEPEGPVDPCSVKNARQCRKSKTCTQEGPNCVTIPVGECNLGKNQCKASNACTWAGGRCSEASGDPCAGKSAKKCRRDASCTYANGACSSNGAPVDPCAGKNDKKCRRASGCTFSNGACATTGGVPAPGDDCAGKNEKKCRRASGCTFANGRCASDTATTATPSNTTPSSTTSPPDSNGAVDPCNGKNARKCGRAAGCTFIDNKCESD